MSTLSLDVSLHLSTGTTSPLYATDCDTKPDKKTMSAEHDEPVKNKPELNRPHACDVCGKGFILAHHLASHSLTHTGLKPFPCKLCTSRFTQLSSLRRHINKLHGTNSGDKPIRSRKTMSLKHPTVASLSPAASQTAATQVPLFQQPVASQSFSAPRLPVATSSGIAFPRVRGRHPCPSCGKTFKTRFTMRRHIPVCPAVRLLNQFNQMLTSQQALINLANPLLSLSTEPVNAAPRLSIPQFSQFVQDLTKGGEVAARAEETKPQFKLEQILHFSDGKLSSDIGNHSAHDLSVKKEYYGKGILRKSDKNDNIELTDNSTCRISDVCLQEVFNSTFLNEDKISANVASGQSPAAPSYRRLTDGLLLSAEDVRDAGNANCKSRINLNRGQAGEAAAILDSMESEHDEPSYSEYETTEGNDDQFFDSIDAELAHFCDVFKGGSAQKNRESESLGIGSKMQSSFTEARSDTSTGLLAGTKMKQRRRTTGELEAILGGDERMKESYDSKGCRRFQCLECHKTFRLAHHLANHMNTHTGERPFTCTLCEHSFSQKSSLRRHITNNCPVTLATSRAASQYCQLCDERFPNAKTASLHMKDHLTSIA